MSVTKTNNYDTGVKAYPQSDVGNTNQGGTARSTGDHYVGAKSGSFDPMASSSGQPNMSGYGVRATPPSGDYAIFVQEAVTRLVSFSSKRGNVFDASVIFQNGSRLEFDVTRTGTSLVANLASAQFTNQSGQIEPVSMWAVEGFNNRFQFGFVDGITMPLQFEIQATERAGFERVVLSRNQPVESFSQATDFQERFVNRTEAWPEPQATVLHVQAMSVVSTGSSSFGQGGFANFEIYLSDGHVIQLTVDSNHHDGARYRIVEAILLSPEFSTLTGKGIKITNYVKPKEGAGRNGETIAITIHGDAKKGLSQGLEVVVPLRLPDQGVGGVRYESGARAVAVPSRKVLATAASAAPTTVPAGQVFDPRGAIALLPTPETASLMSRPPLANQTVDLRFVGEIGGRRVTARAPLTVRGHFKGDDFIPDDTMQMVIVEALGEADTTNYISYEVVDRGDAGYELRFVTISGTRVPVHSQLFAQLFAFGTHEADTLSRLGGLYGRQRLPIDGFRIPDDFAPAPDVIFAEVRRFMSHADVDWQDADAVEVSEAANDLVRVNLANGLGLHLRRTVTDGEVSYEILGTATEGYQVYALGLRDGRNLSITGLWLHTAGRDDEVVVPWQGAMTLNSATSTSTLLHYEHPLVPSLQVRYDLDSGRLNIHFPVATPQTERRAFVPTADQDLDVYFENDGTERELVAVLEDGNLLEITFPGDSPSDLTPLDVLEFDPAETERAYGGEYDMRVRLLSPRGNVLAANGSIDASGNFWTIRFPASQIEGWPQRAVELVHAPGVLALRIFDMPRVARTVAMRPDPSATPPAPPPVAPPVIPRAFPQPSAAPPAGAFRRGREAVAAGVAAPLVSVIEGFPWLEGLVLLPDELTRTQMRRVNNEEDQPTVGERLVFTFAGHTSLAENRRLLVDVPMVFVDHSWQPDRAQVVVARVLTADGSEVSRDTRAVHIVRSSSGWGLQIGESAAQVLHYFRVMLTVPYGDGTAMVPSPDAAFVMGERTTSSEGELTKLEATTGAAALALPLDYDAPRSVVTRNPAGAAAAATAQFYDPLWRTSITINSNPAILELSPGLVADRPTARLSRLGLYDMTGVQGYFVFQQDADAVTLVAVLSGGQPLSLSATQVEELGSGLFEYRGDLPSAYDSLAGTRTAYSLPVRIRWQVVGTAISIVAIQMGDQPEFRPTHLRYDPAEYSIEQIRLNRQPRDVRANQRRVTPIERPTTATTRVHGPFYLAYPLGIDGVVDGEDAVRDVLLNGRVTDGAELTENFWLTYRINGDGSAARTIQMLVHYNPELQEYEPVLSRNRARLRFARGAGGGGFNTVDVPCTLNPRAQSQWMLTLDNGQVFYFSNWSLTQNFTAADLSSGGRPYPLLWRSGSAEPRRTHVAEELARRGLTTGIPVVSVPLPDGGDRVVAVVTVGRDEYRVPLRETNHPSLTKPIPIPDNAMAEHYRDGTEMAPVPIEFFQYVPDRPGVIRFAGMEFEMQIQGRRDSTRGRRIELTRLMPGETGTATERRIRRSLVIGPNGPSSHVLVDLDLSQSVRTQWETLQREAPAGTNVRGLFLRRGFQDVISRERFEFVFRVARTPFGERLAFVGLARILSDDRVEVLPLTYAVIGNTCYLRLNDTGEYLSFSTRLSGNLLQVTSSGTNLPNDILNRAHWIAANPTAEVFSGEVVERPNPSLPDANSNPWRDNRDTRVETRDHLSRTYGIEPWLLQRMLDTFGTEEDSEFRYSGIRLGHPDGRSGGDSDFRVLWFPVAAGRDDSGVDAIYESGMFSGVDTTRTGDTRQGYIRFRIQDVPHEVMDIPFTLLQRHGLRFLVLHGPLEGVVLTESHNGWGDYYFDIRTREILERDLTGLPSVRTRGSDVYSDERPEVVAARQRHVARIRMSDLAAAGVLPTNGVNDLNYWLHLSQLLIPDAATFTYRQTNLHRAFRLLLTAEEDWNLQGRHTAEVRVCIAALQSGRLQYADFSNLIDYVEIYARWRNNVDRRDVAYGQMRDELTRLAEFTPTTAAAPAMPSTRDRILNAPIDLLGMRTAMDLQYGIGEQTYTQQVLHPDQLTELAPVNLRDWLAAIDGYASGYRFVPRQGAEALAEYHRRLASLSDVQPSPTLLNVALTLEFGYRLQQGDVYNATNAAVITAAVDRLITWQTFLHTQILAGSILPDAPIVTDRAQLERLVREVVMVPLAAVPRPVPPKQPSPRPRSSSSGKVGTSPRTVTVAPTAFSAYDNLFADEPVTFFRPHRATPDTVMPQIVHTNFGPVFGLDMNINVTFSDTEVTAVITDASLNQDRYRIPVFILEDGRFFISGRIYQVIVNPSRREVVGVIVSNGTHDPAQAGVAVGRPDVTFNSEDDLTPKSREFSLDGVRFVEAQTDFLSGTIGIADFPGAEAFPYEIDLRDMHENQRQVALIRVGTADAVDAELAARELGMGVVLLTGTDQLDLDAAQLGAVMEELRPLIAQARDLPPASLRMRRGDLLLSKPDPRTVMADAALLPSQLSREIYHSVHGVEIEWDLVQAALQVYDKPLALQIARQSIRAQSDLGAWVLVMMGRDQKAVFDIWERLQTQGVDVIVDPEALIYELLVLETHRQIAVDVTVRDAFAVDLRQARLQDNVTVPQGTEAFRQAIAAREEARHVEERARHERVIEMTARRR